MIPHRRIFPWVAIALLLSGAACKQVPELDEKIPENLHKAPYPELIRLDDSLFGTQTPQEQSQDTEEALSARRDRLQSRAAGLTAPVVDPETRKRMQGGINQ